MSLYKDASLVMIPSAYKDGKLYSIRPVPEYGTELVTNGGFDTDSDWSINGSNIAISGGKANFTNAVTNTDFLQQAITAPTGVQYRIQFEVSNLAAGDSIKVRFPFQDTTINSNGLHTLYSEGTHANFLRITPNSSTGTFSIDNVSVKEVSNIGDFTFSRGSNLAATRVDVNGLIEKGRENLLLQSNQFDTTWVKSSSVLTLTDNQSGYDGLSNAWKLESTSSISSLSLSQTEASSGLQVFSVYAKAGSVDWVRINLSGLGNRFFNISNGTIGSAGSLEGTITSAGNGWYRCSVLGNGSSTAPYVFLASDNNNLSVNAGDNIYIQDAQLEQGLVATDYIETGTSAAQSGILEDMPRLDYSGGASCPSLLLEPQRSNLLEQAEYFGASYWSKANVDVELADTLSPDGFKNAYKITETSASGQHAINVFSSSRPNLSAGSHTHSCFVKVNGVEDIVFYNNGSSGGAGVNIDLSDGSYSNLTGGATAASVEPYSNNWYRITLTFTAVVGNSSPSIYLRTTGSYTGDGVSGIYIYGMQTEQGSYPTSYIPTYGTSQTRSVDNPAAVIDSSLIGQTSGTLFVEATIDNLSLTNACWVAINDGATTTNRVLMYASASNRYRALVRFGGNTLMDVGGADINAGEKFKACLTYGDGVINFYVNGVLNATASGDTTATSPLSHIFLDESSQNNCKISQFAVFPTALTDSECIALTTL